MVVEPDRDQKDLIIFSDGVHVIHSASVLHIGGSSLLKYKRSTGDHLLEGKKRAIPEHHNSGPKLSEATG